MLHRKFSTYFEMLQYETIPFLENSKMTKNTSFNFAESTRFDHRSKMKHFWDEETLTNLFTNGIFLSELPERRDSY